MALADPSDVDMNAGEEPSATPTQKGSNESQDSESEWVRLQSTDGFSYIIRRKIAQTSGTIRNMLAGEFAEAQSKVCQIDERGIIVEKLVEYMSFRSYYETTGVKDDVPIKELQERIPPEIVLELLLAADYHEM